MLSKLSLLKIKDINNNNSVLIAIQIKVIIEMVSSSNTK